MGITLTFPELFLPDSKHYHGDCFFVEIKDKSYSFIKGSLETLPRKFGNNLYDVKVSRPGAYAVMEIVSGKIYFGSSKDVYKRVTEHKSGVVRKRHPNKKFEELLRNEQFKIFDLVVIFTETREEAYSLEQFFLDEWKDQDRLLNIAHDARCAMRGAKLSKEHLEILSKVNRDKIVSEESRAKMALSRKTSPLAISQLAEVHEKKRRRVRVDAVEYESITEARSTTGLSESVIRKKISKCKDDSSRWLEDSKNPLAGRTLSLQQRQKLSAIKKSKGMEQFEKMRELSRKPIILNGVLYKSVRDAVRLTSISEPVIHRKLRESGGKDVEGPYVLDYVKLGPKKIMFKGEVYNSAAIAAEALGIPKTP